MALFHADFFSNVLGLSMQMDVILPQRTQGQIGMEGSASPEKIRTLYLLHGMSDDQTIWQRRTSIERYATEYGIAVVMPAVGLSWYTDMYQPRRYRYFTYVARELPAICRGFFPNLSDRREDTFVAGLSMGGYGALKCGLLAPETFSKAASLSGAVDIVSRLQSNDLGSADYWESIFGPADQAAGSENDLFAAAENLRMRDHLTRLGYNLSYSQSEGNHSWPYWDEHIRDVLKWMLEPAKP